MTRHDTSLTQRLARTSAMHPWRIVAAWGLVLVASVAAIAGLLGSALNSDSSITTHPESMRADEALVASFPQSDRVDEAVVICSAQHTADDAEFREFVAGLRSALVRTGATRSVGDPY